MPGQVRGEDLADVVAKAERRAAAKAKRTAREVALGAVPANERTAVPRAARDEREAFAGRAMMQLAGRCDGARLVDGSGFNKLDASKGSTIGAALACGEPLTDDDWAWCLAKAVFYRRQVGAMPVVVDAPASVPVTADMQTVPPPPCASDIFKDGVGLCVLDARSHAAESWVQAVAAKSGQRVDWHYSGGRANVLVLGDHGAALAAARELAPTLDGRVLRFSEDQRALYRDGDPLLDGVIAVG